MIGAHPDDEDTALLTYLARGLHARTGYLSLTRGDGGQNIIGPELGEALGVIRTEELMQARRLDGAEQLFTRAYDYGFSKTLSEAKQKWDEKLILCDVVQGIRSFRPQVVIAQFTGTPVDGHGQHQFAGYIAPIAVRAAADGSQCREAGPAWTVSKFYVRHRGSDEATITVNTGRYDPVLGRSYFEIAMHARSQHRSQEQGVLELKGAQYSSIDLITPAPEPGKKEDSVFDGISLAGSANTSFVDTARDIRSPEKLLPRLAELLSSDASSEQFDPSVKEAILRASGTRIDVLADRDTAVPGESFPVSVKMFQPSPEKVSVVEVSFNLPHAKAAEPATGSQAPFRREVANFSAYFTLTVPPDAKATQPFWLWNPRKGDVFEIPTGFSANPPFGSSAVIASVTCEISGKRFVIRRPVEFRFADDIRGEIRRELNVVPKISVAPDRNLLIVSTRTRQLSREVSVGLTNHVTGPASGKVRLVLPLGWTSTPTEVDFALTRKGESTSVKFNVNIPKTSAAGSFEIRAEAVSGTQTFTETMQTVSYEHIQTHRIYRPAKIDVKVIDLETAPVKVGYIRGSGDRVPDAIQQLGLNLTEIDSATLASGDLSKFDTIVVGIRAYQVREDIVANNKRLLDFANNGGTLIVQYQLPPSYAQRNLTPFPTQMGPRVVDENATVTIAEPAHAIFNFPNKITSEDFSGWVQERNLYNFTQMDPKYIGLLESHDAGEAENKGGLVVADIGKGKYIYCSYSLFRQLPAGVPGAYRLLANMLSLPKAPK